MQDPIVVIQLVGERLDPSRLFAFPFPLTPPSVLTPDVARDLLAWTRAQSPPTTYHRTLLTEFAIFLHEYV